MLQITRKADGRVLHHSDYKKLALDIVKDVRFRGNGDAMHTVLGHLSTFFDEHTVTDPDTIPRKEVEEMLREMDSELKPDERFGNFLEERMYEKFQSIAKKRGFEL